MSLAPGATLGPYEILSKLGEGGMGEVYRARDTKLNRDVAIKVLPNLVARDAERLARFRREAEVLASLNHPNIAAIYGFEERQTSQVGQAGRTLAIVMELVEGEDLSQRIARGALPLDDALPIATQIAAALEAAHEQGIIHRDLKPANIKVRPDGTAKVLDFGLAKAIAQTGPTTPSASPSSTATTVAIPANFHATLTDDERSVTQAGMILGTVPYMSPEQARGKPVDRRGDIWAFGCVLYEMLSGRRAFSGESLSETLAAVLTHDPEWEALPPATPSGMRGLLERCLDRDPRMRLRDIGEVRIALSTARRAGGRPSPSSTPSRTSGPLRIVEVSETVGAAFPAISPDGCSVAYTKSDGLWVRRLDRLDAFLVVSDPDVGSSVWSSSGDALAYFSRTEVRIVRIDGSERRTVWRPSPDLVFRQDVGLAWHKSAIYVPARGGILRVPLDGSEPVFVARWNVESDVENYRFPVVVDDGRTIVVNPIVFGGKKDVGTIWAFQNDTGRKVLTLPETSIVGLSYSSETGDLLIAATDRERIALWTARFDSGRLTAGTPRLVLDGVSALSLPSADGTLACLGGLRKQPPALLWLDSASRQTSRVSHGSLDLRNLALSPDGRYVAGTASPSEGAAQGLWVYDLDRGLESPTVPDNRHYAWPSWSPDGRLLAFTSATGDKPSVQLIRPGQAAPPLRLALGAQRGFPTWRSDGQGVIFARSVGTKGTTEIAEVGVTPGSRPRRVGQIPDLRGNVSLSPSGRLLAYDAGTGDRSVVAVTTFPDLATRVQLSRESASLPQWSPAGDEVWFLEGAQLVAVRVGHDVDGQLTVGDSRTLLVPSPWIELTWTFRDIVHRQFATVDGQRFLIPGPETVGERRVTLVQNLRQMLQPGIP